MTGEKAGYLSGGEDEDQIEEKFERSDAPLDRLADLRRRGRRARCAYPMPSSRRSPPSYPALEDVLCRIARSD